MKIEVDPLQFPTKENGYFAICKATATSKFGEIFVDVGDANSSNCNAKVSKHLLRMASTQAKARALRDLDDIGMTCLEELGDLDEVLGEEASDQGKFRKSIPKKSATPAEPKAAGETKPQKGNGSNGRNGSLAMPKSGGSKPKEIKPESKPEEAKPKLKPETKADASQMSSAQKNAIYNLSRRRGISEKELEKMARENYGGPLESLSAANASAFTRTLQQSA